MVRVPLSIEIIFAKQMQRKFTFLTVLTVLIFLVLKFHVLKDRARLKLSVVEVKAGQELCVVQLHGTETMG